ncbi:MAG: hypothetical protein KC416_11910, partial [Myxococcales bacterium]|nr:hypothetical protein [Myxococcales bacterium]
RWTGKDPIGFGGRDTNLLAYSAHDPVNFSDPNGLLFGGAIDAGEGYGEDAARWYADQFNDADTWYEKLGYGAGGLLSSLWTNCTSDSTAGVLGSAAVGSAIGRGIGKGGWMNRNRYLRIGWGRHGGRRVFRVAGKLVGKHDIFKGGPL